MQYGAPIWLNNTITSSFQIERLRKFERKIIRQTSNSFRSRGNFKYINNQSLYEIANVNRIDSQFLKITIKFLRRCGEHVNEFIRGIIEPFQEKKYYNSSHLLKKLENNLLYDNNERLIEFHIQKHDRTKLAYNLNQGNKVDIK